MPISTLFSPLSLPLPLSKISVAKQFSKGQFDIPGGFHAKDIEKNLGPLDRCLPIPHYSIFPIKPSTCIVG